MSNSTETVMQFTDEHFGKRFQAHRFLYCDLGVSAIFDGDCGKIINNSMILIFYQGKLLF